MLPRALSQSARVVGPVDSLAGGPLFLSRDAASVALWCVSFPSSTPALNLGWSSSFYLFLVLDKNWSGLLLPSKKCLLWTTLLCPPGHVLSDVFDYEDSNLSILPVIFLSFSFLLSQVVPGFKGLDIEWISRVFGGLTLLWMSVSRSLGHLRNCRSVLR